MKITFTRGPRDATNHRSNKTHDVTTSGVLVRLSDSSTSNCVMISEGSNNDIVIRICKDTNCTIFTKN